MSDNAFFKPTLLYKEYMILDLIEKNKDITQREIAEALGVAVSMVNQYLDSFEKMVLIKRKKHSLKNVEYFVTRKGAERRKVLNISYLNASLKVFISAKENIVIFLDQIVQKGFNNIILYGAGEVAEILLQSIMNDGNISIKVSAVIDDDIDKLGNNFINTKIIQLQDVYSIDHDGILISSYTNHEIMLKNLLKNDYNKNKIIQFFD